MTEALAPRHPAIVATFGKYSNHGLVLCLCRKKDKTICLLRIRQEITQQQPCALCLRPLLERKMLDPVSRRCWHFEWVNFGMAWPTGLACRLQNPGLDSKNHERGGRLCMPQVSTVRASTSGQKHRPHPNSMARWPQPWADVTRPPPLQNTLIGTFRYTVPLSSAGGM